MPLPTSGPLTLENIQTEFGGTNPIGLNEYYAGGGLVPSGTTGTNGAVPSSGAISIFNFYGTSAALPFGQVTYSVAGTYTFVVPAGYTSISAVCVGGGSASTFSTGGGGGALSYSNNISVTAGESLTVVVGVAGIGAGVAGGDSRIARGGTNLLLAKGGSTSTGGQASAGIGAVRYSGGNPGNINRPGGGGAAGYAGNGGYGGDLSTPPQPGAGGGGGGGGTGNDTSGGGGGVGLIVQGASGAAGIEGVQSGGGGGGGSGGASATGIGGAHGGGGGANFDGNIARNGGVGGVRIIYGGVNKNYPFNSAP